jgi:hypothetical protein
MSVSQADVVSAFLLGSTNIPVTVITPLGSLPLTGAWCVWQNNLNQDLVYVAIPGWAGPTTPVYSIDAIDASNGSTTPIVVGQPGIPWGVCVVTVSG